MFTEAPRCRAQLRDIFDSGTTLQLQFPAEDLGFTYPSRRTPSANPSDAPPATIAAAVARTKAARAARAAPPRRAAQPPGKGGAGADAKAAKFVPRLQVGGRLPHFELELHGSCAASASFAAVIAAVQDRATGCRPASSVAEAERAAPGRVRVSSIDLASMCRGRQLCLLYLPRQPAPYDASACDSKPLSEAAAELLGRQAHRDAVVVVVAAGAEGAAVAAGEGEAGTRMAVDARAMRAFAAEHGGAPVWLAADAEGQLGALAGGRGAGMAVRPDGHIAALRMKTE